MVKGYMAFSLSMEVCEAIRKIKDSGRYKSSSAFVEKCIRKSFESEFPDIEDSEKAIRRAEELEFAAKQYREQANIKLVKVESQLTEEDEEILKASASPASPVAELPSPDVAVPSHEQKDYQ